MAVKTMLGRDMRCTADKEDNNLLSGFLFCADCGQAMVRKTVPSGNKKYVYYVCPTAKHKKGCSSHCISACEIEKAVFHSIHDQVELVLNLDTMLERISRMPAADRKSFNYDMQIVKLSEEIERYQGLKLRLYEDLSDGIIDKGEYAEFRNRYSSMIADKSAALDRVKREKKEAAISGITERHWVTLFKEYQNIAELDRRVLMALVDKILIHEEHGVEIRFKYRNEHAQASDYAAEDSDRRAVKWREKAEKKLFTIPL